MAYEMVGHVKKTRKRKSNTVGIQASLDYESLDILKEVEAEGKSRSEALRELVKAGYFYLTIIKPERLEAIRRQEEAIKNSTPTTNNNNTPKDTEGIAN